METTRRSVNWYVSKIPRFQRSRHYNSDCLFLGSSEVLRESLQKLWTSVWVSSIKLACLYDSARTDHQQTNQMTVLRYLFQVLYWSTALSDGGRSGDGQTGDGKGIHLLH